MGSMKASTWHGIMAGLLIGGTVAIALGCTGCKDNVLFDHFLSGDDNSSDTTTKTTTTTQTSDSNNDNSHDNQNGGAQ